MTFLYRTKDRSNRSVITDGKQISKISNPYTDDVDRLRRRPNYFSFTGRKQEYDFTEAYRIVDTETFVAAALQKKKNLILKDGFKFISDNEKDIEYIKRRLEEIGFVSSTSFKDILEQIVDSTLHNHNAFLSVVRKEESSSGNVRKEFGKKVKPIAAYFYLPETQVRVLENRFNEVVGYEYDVCNGINNYFNKDEVLHLRVNKKPTANIGTPPLEAVKDDIISLRQIEESLERLIYKLSIPLIHAKVGTELKPAGINKVTGVKEIDEVSAQMMSLDEAGGITTSERVEIKMIGAENHALRLEPSLQYYKNRVLVGLAISDVDLGIGTTTTGGAAEIVSEALRQNIEMYQHTIEEFITDHIITPLLLEQDRHLSKQYLEEKDKVLFKFNKSNVDVKIKLESHMINELNAKVITQNEYRVATGRKPFTEAELNKINGVLETSSSSEPKGSTYNVSNVTNPSNQYSKSIINDELNISGYLNTIAEGNPDSATSMLASSIHNLLNSVSNITYVECIDFVKPLTQTTMTNILPDIPFDTALKVVEKVLCKNIIEYTELNIRDQE